MQTPSECCSHAEKQFKENSLDRTASNLETAWETSSLLPKPSMVFPLANSLSAQFDGKNGGRAGLHSDFYILLAYRIHCHQSRVFARTFTNFTLRERRKQTDRRGGVSDLSIFELSFPASRNRMRRVREAPQKNNPEKTLRRGRSLDNRSNNSEWIGKEFHYPDDR